jgi:hypothetical protein
MCGSSALIAFASPSHVMAACSSEMLIGCKYARQTSYKTCLNTLSATESRLVVPAVLQ